MKEFTVEVSDEIGEAFHRFCEEYHATPNDVLETVVNLYGDAHIIVRKMRRGEVTKDEAATHLGKIIPLAKSLYGFMIPPMPYPFLFKLVGDLVKCMKYPRFRAEPWRRA